MKEPKTMKGKLSLLIQIAKLAAEDTGTQEENEFFNSIIAHVQNELGDNLGQKILEKYKLRYDG